MKIIEVRDGFVKIESEKKIEISSFLELKGLSKKYVAQVIRSKNNGIGYNIYAKILFINDGMLRKYDKTMPDYNAEISEFAFETVNNSFNYTNPVVAGKFISDNTNILLDSEIFNNLTLVSVDSPEMNDILVQNLSKQFKQIGKTIIIDMLGVLNGDKYVAGRDFKLPLNRESLKFMYEDCLNDATSDSKNLIREIFTDLAEYSESVKFVPFSALKTIVDDMVEKSHVFKLLVLKNKLAKFDSAGYFASGINDANNLSKILGSDFAIIDLSKIDPLFQNRYLSVILSELEGSSDKSTVFVEVSNAINKKNIKTLLYSDKINTTFVTHSKFKYLADIKPLFKNYIIEKSTANKDIFNLYSFFIESMKQDNYLIVGEGTNYVPIISTLEKYDVEIQKLPQDAISEEVIISEYDSQVTDDISEIITEEVVIQNPHSNTTDIVSEDFINELNSEAELSDTEEVVVEEIVENSDSLNQEDEPLDNIFNEEETVIDIDENNAESAIEEPVETIIEEDINTETEGNDEIIPQENLYDDDNNLSESNEVSEIPEDNDFSLVNDENYTDLGEETISEENVEPEEIKLDDVMIPDELSADIDAIEQETAEDDVLAADEDELPFEPKIVPLDDTEYGIGEFKELNESEMLDSNDDDILVDLNDDIGIIDESNSFIDSNEDQRNPEEIERDIVEDVDKVFTTMKDDNISDSDLDLIDSLNDNFEDNEDVTVSENEFFAQGDEEILNGFSEENEEEEAFLEPLEEVSDSKEPTAQDNEILETRESSTPMVPIYDAGIPEEDKVVSDEIEQGDAVVHAKYGSGIVEKMIKYGNKNLYSINFDNVGRRLLDPTLTEIKKA